MKSVADSGGGPGAPPLRESKKPKKGPINGKCRFEVTEKVKFCATTPPPPPLNLIGFLRSRKNSATTPPPTESHRVFEITEKFCYYPLPPLNRVDMALHTKAGPLLRKILDLRLEVTHVNRNCVCACERACACERMDWRK